MTQNNEESVTNETESPPAEQEKLSNAKFHQLLTQLPFQIFLMVASADGKIDADEFLEFTRALEDRSNFRSPYLKGVIRETVANLPDLRVRFEQKKITKDPDSVRLVFQSLFRRLEVAEVKTFAEDLIRLGQIIGNASGGGMLGMKKALSEEEEAAINEFISLVKESAKESNNFSLDE